MLCNSVTQKVFVIEQKEKLFLKLELRPDKKAFYEESCQIPLTVFFYDLQWSENTF